MSAAAPSRQPPARVVEGDPLGDAEPGLAPVRVTLEIDILVLRRALQSLYEDVVHPPPAAIRRDAHAGSQQGRSEFATGELTALVGVEDLRPAVARLRLLRRLDAE